TGDVEPGPADRPPQLADDDAVALVAVVLPQLVAVELEDRGPGRFQRLPRQGRDGGQRGVELGLGNPELVDGGAVEAGGELANGGVAAGTDGGQQLAHGG